jgi:phosphatidylglycerol:prolipoprotein diacylglycerol transferase
MFAVIPAFDEPKIPLDFLFGDGAAIHGFGILVALGFVIGGNVAMARARKLGLDPEVINRLIGWLVVGTFVGGHVGFGLMYAPEEYLSNPIEFLKFWRGLSSFGGFAVCVPLSVWFFWKEKVPIWPYLDCLAHGMAVGWFFGRMGCFVAHDHPGTPSDFLLAVEGICKSDSAGVACHDLGLYEALWSLMMFGLFKAMDRVPRIPGIYPLILGTVYGPVRFGMDYLRPLSTDVRYLGFTPGQYWSTIFFLVCVYFLVMRLRSGDAPLAFTGPADAGEGDQAA